MRILLYPIDNVLMVTFTQPEEVSLSHNKLILRKTNGKTNLSLGKDRKTISAIYFEEKKIEEVNLPGGKKSQKMSVIFIAIINFCTVFIVFLFCIERDIILFLRRFHSSLSQSTTPPLSIEHGEGEGTPSISPLLSWQIKCKKGKTQAGPKESKKCRWKNWSQYSEQAAKTEEM